jgi:hypothetical protein
VVLVGKGYQQKRRTVKVYNINWIDESGNEEMGTALFSTQELAQAYVNRMLAPISDSITYEVGELFVVTEL